MAIREISTPTSASVAEKTLYESILKLVTPCIQIECSVEHINRQNDALRLSVLRRVSSAVAGGAAAALGCPERSDCKGPRSSANTGGTRG